MLVTKFDERSDAVTVADTAPAASSPSDSAAAGHRPSVLSLLLGTSVIFFLLGSVITEFRCFPYSQFLQPSFTAARALHQQLAVTASLRETDLWASPRFERRGVVTHQRDKAFGGYTLYTSGHDSAAFLVDMEGHLRHRWHVPFRKAWPKPPHIQRPVPEPFVHWRRAHLLPNGDLIAMYEAAGDTPWGYGLIKVDRESNVLWKLAEHTHHDLAVRPDGSIITLSHQWRDSEVEPVAGADHLGRVLLDDFVLVVSPAGQVQQRISLLNAIAASDYKGLLTAVADTEWDLLHTNTVEQITPEFADHHEFARPGQIMISMRSRNALAILDLESARIVWASCGPFHQQHDPDVLANGRILLFDNRGHVGPGGPSRILELDPASQAIQWMYTGTEDDPFYSHVRSTQQPLPNGNILITESDGGRILEVTRLGEVVWEFRNPATLGDGPPSIAIVCGATRLAEEAIQFQCDIDAGSRDFREQKP